MAERRPETFAELGRVWSCCANGGEMSDGPVATMHSILQGMGWHWHTPTLFMREGRSHLGLLEGPESWWLHEIRQGLRLAEWRRAGNRRNDMRGIESMAGIDKIPPEQRNDLRELLCGCVWTQKRQFDCQRAETPLCPFCGEEPVDEEHILWWEMLRREKKAPNDLDRSAWPPCTSRCGIFLEDPESAALADKGGNDAADALASAAAAFPAAPQLLTDAAIDRQRTAWDTHSFAAELLFRRRVALLALHEADHC